MNKFYIENKEDLRVLIVNTVRKKIYQKQSLKKTIGLLLS